MTEPVFVGLGFRNDGGSELPPACISQVPMGKRGGVYQHLSENELRAFGDNLTLFWEAEWNGEGYDLIRPISRSEAEAYSRCPDTEDLFS